jgi:hypothetical protein
MDRFAEQAALGFPGFFIEEILPGFLGGKGNDRGIRRERALYTSHMTVWVARREGEPAASQYIRSLVISI